MPRGLQPAAIRSCGTSSLARVSVASGRWCDVAGTSPVPGQIWQALSDSEAALKPGAMEGIDSVVLQLIEDAVDAGTERGPVASGRFINGQAAAYTLHQGMWVVRRSRLATFQVRVGARGRFLSKGQGLWSLSDNRE